MRRAAELLATTHLKIEIIASEVGYQNPFVFSNTSFKKWTGWRPFGLPRPPQPHPPQGAFRIGDSGHAGWTWRAPDA
jgi:AraC-like DNA-binding protein